MKLSEKIDELIQNIVCTVKLRKAILKLVRDDIKERYKSMCGNLVFLGVDIETDKKSDIEKLLGGIK